MQDTENRVPSLDDIRAAQRRIEAYVTRTPVHLWQGLERLAGQDLGKGTEVYLKLEVFQPTGTFKVRGAINNALAMDAAQRRRGITTISAGNHAIAASYAAASVQSNARVVMMAAANSARIAAARLYGAEVHLAQTIEAGFQMVEDMKRLEGRTYIPSFPNEGVVLGTATIALELFEQIPDVEAIVVPIGGGGLISGIATCAKLINPACKVYGVEALGAGVMSKSLKAGSPQHLDHTDTIADSIAPPVTNEYALSLVRRFVDEIVQVSDDQMAAAAALLFSGMKLAVEPAGAATTAALLGPLKERLRGMRVALILCGSNIDASGYASFLARGMQVLAKRQAIGG